MQSDAQVQNRFSHSLIIGGTGMLAQATYHIAQHSAQTTLLARHASNFCRDSAISGTVAIDLDYNNIEDFTEKFLSSCPLQDIDCALLWMHSTGRKALHKTLSALTDPQCQIYHLIGSSRKTAKTLEKDTELFRQEYPHLDYNTIILGSKITDTNQRRWLTHQEISEGTLHAIQNRRSLIIGDI